MKLLRVFLSLVTLANFSLIGSTAVAGTLSIESGSISKAEANVQSLGKLQFGKARAEITDNRMDVLLTVVDLATGRLKEEKSLTGLILTSKTTGEGSQRILTGGVYFDGGLKLFELDTTSPEYVKTTSGQKYIGKIIQVSRVQLSVETALGTEDFLISDLLEIHSPRFFQFAIPVAEVTGEAMTFTGQAEEMSFTTAPEAAATEIAVAEPAKISPTLPTDKHHMSKKAKIITIAVLGCVIATAIAVPIAVACGTSRGSNNQQRTLEAMAWQQFLSLRR